VSAPITALYAGALTVLVLALGTRVVLRRFAMRIGIGEADDHILRARVRVHGNAVENIPLALLLLLLLELGAASAVWLHVFGVMLLLGRCLHAFGLSRSSGVSFGRATGISLTWTAMLGMAVWLIARYVGWG
jgi:hypothetical protein